MCVDLVPTDDTDIITDTAYAPLDAYLTAYLSLCVMVRPAPRSAPVHPRWLRERAPT